MPNPKRILIIEDDPLQADWLAEEVIWKNFPDADLKHFDSEYSFLKALRDNEIQKWNPDYAILDLLVRYYSPQDLDKLNQSSAVDSTPDPSEAGIRCRDNLVRLCPAIKSKTISVWNKPSKLEDNDFLGKGDDAICIELLSFLNGE